MDKQFEVSFNSPQCGWMAVGFQGDSGEFLTTTAFAPHTNALGELMDALADLAAADESDFEHHLKWNRDPEEYDFVLRRTGDEAEIEIFEYPTSARDPEKRESVFSHRGEVSSTVTAFVETFQQLYDERGIDGFRENWHQDFPIRSLENLKKSLALV